MISVEKISIWPLVLLFVGYLVGHIWIGKKLETIKKQNIEKPGNKETEKLLKNYNMLFKFFPMAYVIVTIIILLSF